MCKIRGCENKHSLFADDVSFNQKNYDLWKRMLLTAHPGSHSESLLLQLTLCYEVEQWLNANLQEAYGREPL